VACRTPGHNHEQVYWKTNGRIATKGWKNLLELAIMTYSDGWMDGLMDDTSKTLIQSPSFSFI
jgi:hypothetical protein